MTKRSVGAIISSVILLFIAGFARSYPIAIAFSVLFIMQILCVLLNLFSSFAFSFEQSLSEEEKITLTLKFKNKIFLPLSVVGVTVKDLDGGEIGASVLLGPLSEKECKLELNAPYRGEYEVGVSEITVSDYFGLYSFKVRRIKAEPITFTVYPALFDLYAKTDAPSLNSDDSSASLATASHGDSFAHPRLYVPGDAMNRIHWKLSVRTQELHSREYELPATENVMICLENTTCGLHEQGLLQYEEWSCECAGSLAKYYINENMSVNFRDCFTNTNSFVTNAKEFGEFYGMLAYIPFGDGNSISRVIDRCRQEGGLAEKIFVIAGAPSIDLVELLTSISLSGRDICLVAPSSYSGNKYPVKTVFPPFNINLPVVLGDAL